MSDYNKKNNNNKNNKNNKNNSRLKGILTLVAWAVVLTVILNYMSAYSGNAANASTSHEVRYSEFVDMVEKGKVDEVLFKDSTIYITPVEGYVFTDEEGEKYTHRDRKSVV